MASMDIQSEQFQSLLAEALRAGPGTPLWHEAVESLRGFPSPAPAAEELALLLRAREDLAAGRDYRTVRAGPGFTRKLMDNLDGGRLSPRILGANAMAAAGAIFVLIALALGAYLFLAPAVPAPSTEQLANTFFVTTVRTDDFRGGLPADAVAIGQLPLDFSAGVRLAALPAGTGAGGGFYLAAAQPALRPFAVEAAMDIADARSSLIAQLFITDDPECAVDTGISPHELAAVIQQGKVRVILPDGRSAAEQALSGREAVTIRIRCNNDAAIIEQNGKPIWSGAHQLSPDRPRYVGVRYLARDGEKLDAVSVRSLKVLQP